MSYQFNTKCLYGDPNKQKKIDKTGSLNFPIYQTATFAHPGVGQSTGYDYSRAQNPTREQLEFIVASLEDGESAIAFSTGMAALATVMELFEPNDHVIASSDLYGGSVRLFDTVNRKNQVKVTYYDTSILEGIEQEIQPETKAIYVETPSNPLMHVTDLEAVANIAKEHNLLFIVDNTFLSPYFQKPLTLGADIVIHSGTKFLGGHNDTLAGVLVMKDKELEQKLRYLQMTTGAVLSPFDSFLLMRGIKTLPLRMDRAQTNAFEIVTFLKSHPCIKEVFYVGLPEHPAYEISQRQSSGFGSMISFRVDSKETAVKVLEHIQLIQYAESLGGVESLLTYPMLQTHADVPVEMREKLGITETFLRMSVGVENIQDLILDLKQALEA